MFMVVILKTDILMGSKVDVLEICIPVVSFLCQEFVSHSQKI